MLDKSKLTTDEYFMETANVSRSTSINPWVKYNVFTRSKEPFIFAGLGVVWPIIEAAGGTVTYALQEGTVVDGGDCITLFIYEGRLQNIVDLETHILGMLSDAITSATEMWKIVKNVGVTKDGSPIPVSYFGARHRSPGICDICWSYGAIVGGARGIAVPRTAEILGLPKASGTIPHAAVLALSENTLDIAKKFVNSNPKRLNRPILDTHGQEITDSIMLVDHFKTGLHGVRTDTCGERLCEGCHTYKTIAFDKDEIVDMLIRECNMKQISEDDRRKYVFNTGVSVESIFRIRAALDFNNGDYVKIIASSGFDPIKTAIFTLLNAPVDAYGCGMMHPQKTFGATSDIVEVDKKPKHKVGRYANDFDGDTFKPRAMENEPQVKSFIPMEVKGVESLVGN